MNKTFDFAIDLGTTNSLIAKFEHGEVQVFKDPAGLKETLPSVIGFRNNRILVGEQARTFVTRDPSNVASRFKRKMGTSEVVSLNTGSKTPVELSSIILKELKGFVHTGQVVESAVITIPASFDTVQSNATKDAGLKAGFKEVVLLQEPIAASLAYANKEKSLDLRNSQWIVYDLGGGTFDVALVKIVEGELTVIDHEGDNYFGGSDFDAIIVEKIIVPELLKVGRFDNILAEMKGRNGRHNRLWHKLLYEAEEAKIQLSIRSSTDIDVVVEDDDGKEIDFFFSITRSDFEHAIKESIDNTAAMMKEIITRNSLQPNDLSFVLMIGGGTYIPLVRKRIEELMGVSVNTSIDPTSAVVIGAAFYAGTKEVDAAYYKDEKRESDRGVKIKTAYNKNSQESEEMFSAKLTGDIDGLSYRIISSDGSFDSGIKEVSSRISEDLPLREGAYNVFEFHVFDQQNNPVDVGFSRIQIAQGRYSVTGQMLPEDISLVRDDLSNKDTRLDRIFPKNGVLPANTKRTVEVAKTVVPGSGDEVRIMVVEGSSEKHSTTNKPIGVLLVSGDKLKRDLIKGSEIDLKFEISESRDLTISAYLNGTGQEFSQVFKGSERSVDVRTLAADVIDLEERVRNEIEEAKAIGNSDAVKSLGKLHDEVSGLILKSGSINDDDVTDEKFKVEDEKRSVAQSLFELTSSKRLNLAVSDYKDIKSDVAELVMNHGNDRERHELQNIISRESVFLSSSNSERVEEELRALESIRWRILMRLPDFLLGMFDHLVNRQSSMNDQAQAKQLIEAGRSHIAAEDWDDLRQVNMILMGLLPAAEKEADDMRIYTGIV